MNAGMEHMMEYSESEKGVDVEQEPHGSSASIAATISLVSSGASGPA